MWSPARAVRLAAQARDCSLPLLATAEGCCLAAALARYTPCAFASRVRAAARFFLRCPSVFVVLFLRRSATAGSLSRRGFVGGYVGDSSGCLLGVGPLQTVQRRREAAGRPGPLQAEPHGAVRRGQGLPNRHDHVRSALSPVLRSCCVSRRSFVFRVVSARCCASFSFFFFFFFSQREFVAHHRGPTHNGSREWSLRLARCTHCSTSHCST